MSNATIQHPFQTWLDDNGVLDVRFFPFNASSSAATSLLDGAYKAVRAYETGSFAPYEDNARDDQYIESK